MKHTTQSLNARAYALYLLAEVLGNRRTIDEAVAAQPFHGSEADGRFAMMLALTTLRHIGQLDALLATYLEKPLPAKRRAITNALRLGAAQLLLLGTPAHAALNETVAAVKRGKDAGLSGLVNAILQKIVRDRPALPDAAHNLPAWLRDRWSAWYGTQAAQAMAQVAATRPPLDLNTAMDMPQATRMDAQMLRLPADHAAVETLPGYQEGSFFVQDLAASYPVRLLGDVRGRNVLDLCAAPGGKTAQLVQRGAKVTAVDRSPARLAVLRENMVRLNHQVQLIAADIAQWQPADAPYDAILLDAPCSATGTWRRHPEVVHITTADDIAQLAQQQRELLARAWAWVKPGGVMVYCVCSLEREEGEDQAAWFRATATDAEMLPVAPESGIAAESIRDGMLRTLPSHRAAEGGMDGFFAVCFRKRA